MKLSLPNILKFIKTLPNLMQCRRIDKVEFSDDTEAPSSSCQNVSQNCPYLYHHGNVVQIVYHEILFQQKLLGLKSSDRLKAG